MIINFTLGANGGGGGVSIETFNKFVQDQNTIDESQNKAIEDIEGDITATRLAVDMSNLDDNGRNVINGMIDTKLGDIENILKTI